MKIKLNTINDVKEFVSECSKYDADIYVNQKKYVVNGKSALGIFSMNLLEPVDVTFDSTNDKNEFYHRIEKWKK